MKCALILFGVCRELEISSKSWSFMEYFKPDVYISTWDRYTIKNTKLDIQIDKEITKDYLLGYFPNAIISLQKELSLFSDDPYNHNEKMIYHWKNALRLIKESNQEYDILILSRFDVYIKIDSWEDKINPEYVYTTAGDLDLKSLHDIFFIGNFNSLSFFIENFPNDTRDIHGDVYNGIMKIEKKHIGIENFHIALARPSVYLIKEEYLNFDVVKILDDLWNTLWQDKFEIKIL